VRTIVYASSVGAYSPGPKDRPVDENWPTHGWPPAGYTREKAYLERVLDAFERDHPDIRVVRLRPGFILKRESAAAQRRLFAGPLLPSGLAQPGLIPAVPDLPGLRFQALHSADAGQAYRLAVTREVRGAFNIAADPVLDPHVLAEALGARRVPVPSAVARALVDLTWRTRLQPTPPGWMDMALAVPVMSTARASAALGWAPARTSVEALLEILEGIADKAGAATPPLHSPKGTEVLR
jgi:UDP-glucose 4-epimerase